MELSESRIAGGKSHAAFDLREPAFLGREVSLAATEEGIAEIDRLIEQSRDEAAEATGSRERRQAVATIAGLFDSQISLYRSAGLLTSDAVANAAAAAHGARVDQLAAINWAVRKALAGHGVDGEIIEDVIDQAVAASGVDVLDG